MTTRGMLAWFVLVCVVSAGPVRGEPPWTEVLTQQALSSGYKATLPPNLARVLGLSPNAESVEVRQLLSRAEQKVRTFNVSVAHHRDLVIFLVDEKAQSTVAYLLAPGGKLRRAVSYHTGGEPRQLSAAEAHPGLTREIHYWSGQAAGRAPGRQSAPKPAN